MLIDTVASTNFVSNKFIQSIKNKERYIEVHPGCLTLKLADNHSITTKGSVNLLGSIQAQEMEVSMHIVDNLAYPIILGCDFLRKEKIILIFDNEQHEMQSIDKLEDSEECKSKVYLYHDIIIPAYHQ